LFFGKSKAPLGKFFNNTFRKKNGKIVAQLGKRVSGEDSLENHAQLIYEAWKSLTSINDHVCIWIDEKKEWANKEFITILKEKD